MSGDFHLAVALISLSAWQCYATRLGAVQLLFLEVQLPQEIGSIHWLNTPTTTPKSGLLCTSKIVISYFVG